MWPLHSILSLWAHSSVPLSLGLVHFLRLAYFTVAGPSIGLLPIPVTDQCKLAVPLATTTLFLSVCRAMTLCMVTLRSLYALGDMTSVILGWLMRSIQLILV